MGGHSEFSRGMRRMQFTGDTQGIFAVLDSDHSGELSLDEASTPGQLVAQIPRLLR